MTDETHTVTINGLTSRGRGKALLSETKALEVISALPDEKVTIRLGPKKKRKQIAFLESVLTPSPTRVTPRCAHVPLCGGCSLQQLDYKYQLQAKEALVKQLFDPLVTPDTATYPIIPVDELYHNRNKMEFSFSENRTGDKFLGLIIAASKGRVFNLTECAISPTWFPEALEIVRSWWENSSLSAYHPPKDSGTLRTLTLRHAFATDQKLAMLTISGNPYYPLPKKDLQALKEALVKEFPEVSFFLRIQQLLKGTPTQFFEMHLHGPDHIVEELTLPVGTLRFKISPTSFFQPNSHQAAKLFTSALKLIQDLPIQTVLDLYSGTGTLSSLFSLNGKKVSAIEINPHAVFDAKVNREVNNLANFEIFCGDVGTLLPKLLSENKITTPDLLILDPPRCGLEPKALETIRELNAPYLLYISCNPKTQVENLQALDYTLLKLQPVDQFPHTMHVENIALLKSNKKNS